jgi:hypothetical protein
MFPPGWVASPGHGVAATAVTVVGSTLPRLAAVRRRSFREGYRGLRPMPTIRQVTPETGIAAAVG